MDVTIYPRRLRGTVTPPPSKSMAHRAVIAELLAGLDTFSVSPTLSEDIRATIACAEALRADDESVLDCGESGSTLRFLIPVALALRGGGTFTGRGRLLQRPQTPYFDIFREKGVFYEQAGNRLTVRGRLTPGEYRLPGDVSSQFVTGLLFALPLLDGESVIRLTSPLQSAAYV
ncbi:MAG: 3-phosphoshikimate 1-carboxyvinyltransferase, partial [Oscillibacter sp.]|nr:3-phosphoshikimate 1-carboxyvinyltransferase [Oscillibacter sp.]